MGLGWRDFNLNRGKNMKKYYSNDIWVTSKRGKKNIIKALFDRLDTGAYGIDKKEIKNIHINPSCVSDKILDKGEHRYNVYFDALIKL